MTICQIKTIILALILALAKVDYAKVEVLRLEGIKLSINPSFSY